MVWDRGFTPSATCTKPAAVYVLGAGVAIAVAASMIAPPGGPALLLNRTPSEPPGFYVRTAREPARGDIIAFKTPAAAFPYADKGMGFLHHRPLLKAVAAVAGDQVCTTAGELVVNGVARATIAAVDRQGRALPHWSGCRRLDAGELFVFSARAPNSFDSRYYGPVRLGDVLGVYTLVSAVAPEAP